MSYEITNVEEYRNTRWRFCIMLPPGWAVRKGFVAWLTNLFQKTVVHFSPRGRKYPQISIQIRDTKLKTVSDVRQLMHSVAHSMHVNVSESGELSIGNIAAYELAYRDEAAVDGAMDFYRVAFVHQGHRFLLQCSSNDLTMDKNTFRGCIQSFRFD